MSAIGRPRWNGAVPYSKPPGASPLAYWRQGHGRWATCVLKAHGHTPTYTRTKGLSPDSQKALAAIGLHWHDLRHEAGSRLLESGWPIHHVAHMLGHASIATTNTYLNATRIGLQEAMRRLDASRCNPVANETETERPPVSNEETASVSNLLRN